MALSTFIPKPHTSFQWASQLSMEESLSRLTFIRSALQSRHIQVKWNDTRQKLPGRGLIQRGSKSGPGHPPGFPRWEVVWTAGGEHFSWDLWEQAFEEEGVDPNDYFQPRNQEDVLPWDFIQTGIGKDYLWAEYQRGLANECPLHCRQGDCNQCGVCPVLKVKPVVFEEFSAPSGRSLTSYLEESLKKFRLLVTKTGPSRFFLWASGVEGGPHPVFTPGRSALGLFPGLSSYAPPFLWAGPAGRIEQLGEFVDVCFFRIL